MVYRVYVEKKPGSGREAIALLNEMKAQLGIAGLDDVRVFYRYDAEGISRDMFEECIYKVFADPRLDNAAECLKELTGLPADPDSELFVADGSRKKPACIFAVETIPEKFDRRADAAQQCIRVISQDGNAKVRCATVYALYGEITDEEISSVKEFVIDSGVVREAPLDKPESLETAFEYSEYIETVLGFTRLTDGQLADFISKMDLRMSEDELLRVVHYFRDGERRTPTTAELRVIDEIWAESRRHEEFDTIVDSVYFEDELLGKAFKDYLAVRRKLGSKKPVCLMDLATVAVRYLRKTGHLDKLDVSEENNACTVKINVEKDGQKEPWLLMLKNTAGDQRTSDAYADAASCLNGCINDPLSGRAYVYSAMRITGSADPTAGGDDAADKQAMKTRGITAAAARGCSDYANQAGLCTGIVDEIYHPGYAAGRMDSNFVLAAAPAFNIRREKPAVGDLVMLIGEDGATEEHKLRRFLRNEDAARLIKRARAFGSGGACIAIGSLADGIGIDMDAMPEKYERPDGTELTTSVSAERVACVIAPENKYLFMNLAADENLRCLQVAEVTEEPRLAVNWNGNSIVDISREFLRTKGEEKHIDVTLLAAGKWEKTSLHDPDRTFTEQYNSIASDINICSRRGLSEMFDSTIGSGSVLLPFGGRNQLTPVQAMVNKIPVVSGTTDDCSMISWGYNPFISEASPYHGAYLAVVESVAKLIATGASYGEIYLCFQEYFESLRNEQERWGKPLSALLGAFEAQMCLGIGAISSNAVMNGSLGDIDVPPALISYAVTMCKTGNVISPEFKQAGHSVYMLAPEFEDDDRGVGAGLPKPASLMRIWEKAAELIAKGKAVAAYTPTLGGVAEAVMKMTYGNGVGFRYLSETEGGLNRREIFGYNYGSIIVELNGDMDLTSRGIKVFRIGETIAERKIVRKNEALDIGDLLMLYESKLDSVFPAAVDNKAGNIENVNYRARSYNVPLFKRSEPKIIIPVFQGTNCEHDLARAVRDAGGSPELMVIRDLTEDDIRESVEKLAAAVKETQILYIPGGFTGGDEPCGAARLIEAYLRSEAVADAVTELLEKREGLICGIGNGFQALLRTGLVPYGKYTDADENSPMLTFNTIGLHQSKIAHIRIASNKSPWLRGYEPGEICSVPVSHSSGKFVAAEETIRQMIIAGQIATQYADLDGNASGDVRFNPNGSMYAVEGITSPDGRVFGRMAHPERHGEGLYRNVEGRYVSRMFENAVKFFR